MSQDPARDAVSRGDWQQAYDLLVEADARSPLSAPDLALLADMAYAAGHLDVTIAAWERAYAQSMAAGDRLAAAGAAVKVAMHLLFDTALMAPVRGWARRCEQLLEGLDETPVHAWLAVVRNYERLLSGDFEEARLWARRAIDTGTKHAPGRRRHRSCRRGPQPDPRRRRRAGARAPRRSGNGRGLRRARSPLHRDRLLRGRVRAASARAIRPGRASGRKRWSAGGRDSPWGASTDAAAFTAPRSSACAGRGPKRRRKRSWPARSCAPTCAGSSGGR